MPMFNHPLINCRFLHYLFQGMIAIRLFVLDQAIRYDKVITACGNEKKNSKSNKKSNGNTSNKSNNEPDEYSYEQKKRKR
jgi:hypothetical protein